MTGKEVLERGERRLRIWLVVIGVVMISITAFTASFFINQHFSHEDAKRTSEQTACHALDKNNEILRRFAEHIQHKSIQNVKAGVTNSTTSIKEIRQFFRPTLKELNEARCEYERKRGK